MRYLLFLSLTSLFCLPLFAQNSIDLITIAGHYSVPQSYESTYSEKAGEHFVNLNMKLPVVLSEKSIWYNDVSYYNFRVDNDNPMPANIANPLNLHGFIMQTGWVQKMNDKNSLLLLFVPRLMSDFENNLSKSFQFGGIALYETIFNDALTMRFGASLTQELFGAYMVPLVYLNWKINPRLSIAGMLPVYAKINYQVTNNLVVGFHHFGLVTSYKLGNENYKNDYIERSSIDLSLFARQRIAVNIHAELRTGMALGRYYAQYSESDKVDFAIPLVAFGDERTQKNINFGNGPFINLRLVYNLPLDQ